MRENTMVVEDDTKYMVSGSTSNTKDRIVRTIRNAEEPALSAADIADHADYSKRTINNHIGDLVDENRVVSTKIGNATAYYIPRENYPSHELPEHHCKRCGREIYDTNDHIRVESTSVQGDDRHEQLYVLCRFCQSDLVSWLHGDDGSMYDYPDVHAWDIPKEQLEKARNNDELKTRPSGRFTSDVVADVCDAVESIGDGTLENVVNKDEIVSELYGEYSEVVIDQSLSKAVNAGLLHRTYFPEGYVAAK